MKNGQKLVVLIVVGISLMLMCGCRVGIRGGVIIQEEAPVTEDSTSDKITNDPKVRAEMTSELEVLMTKIASKDSDTDVQQILETFIKETKLEIQAVYYGNAEGDFWIEPKTQMPENYKFTERPPYTIAVKEGINYVDAYKDITTNRDVQCLSKPVLVDQKVIGVVGMDVCQ